MNNENNLAVLAAKEGLFTVNNIPYTHSEYFNERIKDSKYHNGSECVIPDYLTDNKNIECNIFFECKIQDEGTPEQLYFIERYYILLKRKDDNFFCMLQSGYHTKGKFYLHPFYSFTKFAYKIENYKRTEAIKKLSEPNLIGVFTDKKIDSWFNYCNGYINTLKGLLNTVEDKNKEQRELVNNFYTSLKDDNKSTHTYTSNGDREITTIKCNFFTVRFELYFMSGYMNKTISFEGGLNEIINITNK